jgi:hypothetical protein
MLVAEEMQATMPCMEDEVTAHSNVGEVGINGLVAHIESLTGYQFECCYGLAKQALTHPTVLDTDTPLYERLKWIGDVSLSRSRMLIAIIVTSHLCSMHRALCLATHDWIFRNFPDLNVGAMVAMESALVFTNERLGFLSFESGLVRHMRHQDSTILRRMDGYVFAIKTDGRGLWGTDPPKAPARQFWGQSMYMPDLSKAKR